MGGDGPTVFSRRYKPLNRPTNTLGPADIELEDGHGTHRLTPNDAAVLAFKHELPLTGDAHVKSVISGERGSVYRTYEIELALTREELIRLMRHELEPHEVHHLLAQYGAFFEIHDDFYDEETGLAIQPMSDY